MADTLFVNAGGYKDNLDVWTNQYSPSKLSGGKIHTFNGSALASGSVALATLAAQESSFPGYATVNISGIALPAATLVGAVAQAIAATAAAMVCTGGGSSQSVYGGYVTDSTDTVLIACWNFAAGPFIMLNNGDTIDITPTLSSQSLN